MDLVHYSLLIVYFDNGWAGTGGMFSFTAGTGIPCLMNFIHSPTPSSFPEPGWPE